MTAPNIATYTNDYKFGRGRLLFNQLVNGIYQGFRPLGNCPAFTVGVTTDKFEHTSSEGGLSETDLSKTIKISRTAKITCDNFSVDNLLLFLSAEANDVSQAASPVTDELVASVNQGRTYQLGVMTSNPSGVRGIGSVTVSIAAASTPARANSAPYVVGDYYVPATPNAHYYLCTIDGTSAASPPTFTTDGSTFADGTATFKDMGTVAVASTAGVNYLVDTDLGLLSIVSGGGIPSGISLEVDYTPVAQTRQQIRTTSTADLTGQLKFIADNPFGKNQDLLMPEVTLAASGDLALITDNSVSSMDFEVGINKRDSNTSAIYVDGRAADWAG